MLPAQPVQATRRAGAVLGVLLAVAASPVPASAQPARLRITVEDASVEVGSRTRVLLELLDRDFQLVENDRPRVVRFETRSARAGGEGSGTVSPAQVRIPAGTARYSNVEFAGRRPGAVLIRAVSDGLAPAETVVRVRSGGFFLSRLLIPVLHAQPLTRFEMLPRAHPPLPLNGRSTAQLAIWLDDPVPAGQVARFRVETVPAVRLRFGLDQQLEGYGVASVQITEGRLQSEPIHVAAPAEPGRVRIRARALSDDGTDEIAVQFIPPRPARVAIEPQVDTITSHQLVVPLEVQLLDRDGLPLRALVGSHVIRLETDLGESGSDTFEPPQVILSSTKLRGSTRLQLPGVRLGGALKVFARAESSDVGHGEAEFSVRAAAWVLLALAALGGFLGGLARHVYRIRSPSIWPSRADGRLDPGLVGNALFSALSGLVLFQSIEIGVLHAVDQLAHIHGSGALAFVLGVAGGFAGVVVFEVLTDRVLPRHAHVEG